MSMDNRKLNPGLAQRAVFARGLGVDIGTVSALVANRSLIGAATPFLFPFVEPRGRRFGMLLGAGLFAALYPRLSEGILKKGEFGDLTLPRLFRVNDWVVVVPVAVLIFLLLYWLERAGL